MVRWFMLRVRMLRPGHVFPGCFSRRHRSSCIEGARSTFYSQAICGMAAGFVAIIFRVVVRNADQPHKTAEETDANRLLALRNTSDQPTEEFPRINQNLLDELSGYGGPPEPEMIFYAVKADRVEQVDIYLDERLMDHLNRIDKCAWQGLLEFIEEDIDDRRQ